MPAEVFYDNTTRANTGGNPVTPSTSGHTYVSVSGGGLALNNNVIHPNSGGGSVVDMGSQNNYIFTKIVLRDASTAMYILVRSDVTAANYYALLLDTNLSIHFLTRTAGTGVNSALNVGTYNAGDEIGVVASGTNLYFYKNGSVFYTATPTTHANKTSQTYVGLQHSAGGSPGSWQFTNLYGGIAGGTYAPALNRMAYDRDGTVVRSNSWNGITNFTEAQRVKLNNELNDYYAPNSDGFAISNGSTTYLEFVFPEARNISAVRWGGILNDATQSNTYYPANSPTAVAVQYSPGAWTAVNSPLSGYSDFTSPGFRTVQYLSPSLFSNIYGIRTQYQTSGNFNFTGTFMGAHLYGTIPPAANVHRVTFWHPYLDIPLPSFYLDMDDVGASTVRTRSFRLKNTSPSLGAFSIDITAEHLSTSSAASQLTFKKNSSGSFAASEFISTLAAGAISEVIQVRRTTPPSQVTNLIQAPRVNLTIGSFS